MPIVGDDIKSQVGATIVHRILARLFEDRGLVLDRTYQLNVGGNMDFKNMLERERLESKKISKTQSVTSQIDHGIDADDVHIGPSDHVAWLDDRKWAYIRLEGRNFGDVPLNVELKLEVWDSPNSAGVIIDALRCAKLAKDRGIGGPLLGPSAYFMKSPAGAVPRRRGPPDGGGLRRRLGLASGRRHARAVGVRQDEPVPTDNAAAWDRYAAAYQIGRRAADDTSPTTGRTSPTEAELRLLGDLKGKRVLELGCGGAQCSIAFAKQGATAIGVDLSAEQLAYARRLCEREEVRVELRQGDLADLAFLRADSIDLVFSAYAFGYVEDLNRVFRQVHRVLKVGAPLVFSPPPPGLRHDRRRRRRAAARSAGPTLTAPRSTTQVERDRLHRLPPHPGRDLHGPGPGQLPGRPDPRATAPADRATQLPTGGTPSHCVPRTLSSAPARKATDAMQVGAHEILPTSSTAPLLIQPPTEAYSQGLARQRSRRRGVEDGLGCPTAHLLDADGNDARSRSAVPGPASRDQTC